MKIVNVNIIFTIFHTFVILRFGTRDRKLRRFEIFLISIVLIFGENYLNNVIFLSARESFFKCDDSPSNT